MNRLDRILETVDRPMTAQDVATALELHKKNVQVRMHELVQRGELEVVLPRVPGNQPQRYQRPTSSAVGNAFTLVRPRGTNKGHP